ncbi:MAG: hypothetical protein ABJP70_07725 [Erythrobacter sp.]
MTLENFYFVSQIAAALGIIASLIFVGLQVRHDAEQTRLNTRALKAASAFDAAHSWGSFNESLLTWPDEHFSLVITTHDPDKNWDDFPPEARGRMTAFYRAIFQKLEGQFYMHEYGSLDDDIIKVRLEWAASVIQSPFYQTLWQQEKAEKIYSERFVAALETAREQASLEPFKALQATAESAPVEEGDKA